MQNSRGKFLKDFFVSFLLTIVSGGYENDISLIRLAENHFFMIAPTEQQSRCYSWLRSNLDSDSNVSIQNVSADYTAICIMGPYSKLLLIDAIAKAALASGTPIEDYLRELENFPFFTFKTLPLGTSNVPVLACNLTHTGELGFVLYMRNPQAISVYQTLLDAGKCLVYKNYTFKSFYFICVFKVPNMVCNMRVVLL